MEGLRERDSRRSLRVDSKCVVPHHCKQAHARVRSDYDKDRWAHVLVRATFFLRRTPEALLQVGASREVSRKLPVDRTVRSRRAIDFSRKTLARSPEELFARKAGVPFRADKVTAAFAPRTLGSGGSRGRRRLELPLHVFLPRDLPGARRVDEAAPPSLF
eukprot:4051973-Pleurochrysis_carterae.AAC.1